MTGAFVTALALAAGPVGADDRAPVLEHDACDGYAPGQDVEIRVRIVDASDLFGPKVLFRSDADPEWRHVALTRVDDERPAEAEIGTRGVFAARIPATAIAGALEYLIEALDEHGNGPARIGSPEAPLRLQPDAGVGACVQIPAAVAPRPPPAATPTAVAIPPVEERSICTRRASKPFYCKAWFWLTAGTIVAGGAALAVFAATREPERVGTPDRGVVDLNFEFPGMGAP